MLINIDHKALEHACQCAGRAVHHFDRMALDLPLRASIVAHARAIEQHEAFRQEVSDAVEDVRDNTTYDVHPKLWRYIRTKPDPLVEVLADMGLKPKGGYDWASEFRNALAARGLEIREKQP